MLKYLKLMIFAGALLVVLAFSLDNTQEVLIKFYLDTVNLQLFSVKVPLWVALTLAFILGILCAAMVLLGEHLKIHYLLKRRSQEVNQFKKLAVLKHQELKSLKELETPIER